MNYTVTGQRTDGVNVFHTEFRWFAGAVVIELLAVLVVSYTFYGWWRFGRAASFSPLEMAKAFNSPLLAEAHSNMSGNTIAKTVGDREIKYGVLGDYVVNEGEGEGIERDAERLGFADPAEVFRLRRLVELRS